MPERRRDHVDGLVFVFLRRLGRGLAGVALTNLMLSQAWHAEGTKHGFCGIAGPLAADGSNRRRRHISSQPRQLPAGIAAERRKVSTVIGRRLIGAAGGRNIASIRKT
jgi:hypothetical protein